MKLVNPVGRNVTKVDASASLVGNDIVPYGCLCTNLIPNNPTNSTIAFNAAGGCSACACVCEAGNPAGSNANYNIGANKGRQ